MNTSKLTNTLTGLPGRPKYGLPSIAPNPCGIPRLHRDLVELDLAAAEERGLHHVALPHRHPTRGDERVGLGEVREHDLLERVDVVPDDAGERRHRAGLAQRGEQRVGVRVTDLAVGGVCDGATSSSPVESTTTRGRGWTSGCAKPAVARSPSSGAGGAAPPAPASRPRGRPRRSDGCACPRSMERGSERCHPRPRRSRSARSCRRRRGRARRSRSRRPRRRPPCPRAAPRSSRDRRRGARRVRWPTPRTISEERTANPSIADDAKSGMSRSATRLSASTQPYDSVSGSAIDWSGLMVDRTRSRASSTERSPSPLS